MPTDPDLPDPAGSEPAGSEPAGSAELSEADPAHEETGLDLARSIARGLAGKTPQKRRTHLTGKRARTETRSSGAHADDRDPQLLDSSMGRFVLDQGWETELRVHGVFARWSGIVGQEVSQHVTPQSYADGRLTVRTDSTAWATQMRLLAATVVRRLNEELGDGTVLVIDIVGPNAPKWNRGRFRVKGRGPRDTYG